MFRNFLLIAGLSGCVGVDERYAEDGLITFAVTSDAAPAAMSDEAAAFVIERRVEFPFVPPTPEEMAMLEAGAGQATPFARMPWVRRGDVGVEIDWVIHNLSDTPLELTFTLNGFNEFHEYFPAFTIEDDEIIFDFSGWERLFALPAHGKLEGTIREEEIDEVAIDLATVVNGAPNANEIVYFENQSAHDPRARMFIPAVIPGLTGVRLGVRVGGSVSDDPMMMTAAPPVVVEASVRLRDFEDRVAEEGDPAWPLPAPEAFTPMPPAMMP